eukprot:jgi/Psemu1/15353/gm1.15353_g
MVTTDLLQPGVDQPGDSIMLLPRNITAASIGNGTKEFPIKMNGTGNKDDESENVSILTIPGATMRTEPEKNNKLVEENKMAVSAGEDWGVRTSCMYNGVDAVVAMKRLPYVVYDEERKEELWDCTQMMYDKQKGAVATKMLSSVDGLLHCVKQHTHHPKCQMETDKYFDCAQHPEDLSTVAEMDKRSAVDNYMTQLAAGRFDYGRCFVVNS